MNTETMFYANRVFQELNAKYHFTIDVPNKIKSMEVAKKMAKYEVRYSGNGVAEMELTFLGKRFETKIRLDKNGWVDLITPSLGEQVSDKIQGLPRWMSRDIDAVLCTSGGVQHFEIMEFMKVLQEYEDAWGENHKQSGLQGGETRI